MEAREEVEQPQLPDDIMEQILVKLPIKPLIQCKLPSKHWNSTISDPNFIKKHFNQSVFSHPFTPVESLFIQSDNNFYTYYCTVHDNDVGYLNNLVELNDQFDVGLRDEIKLVGSSNGLICLAEKYGKYFFLYNPATNQSHKYYPGDFEFWNSHPYQNSYASWGFGYVESLDDYKVVRIFQFWNGEVAMVHVFSLKSNLWSKIENGFEEGDMIVDGGRGARLANETLYWSKVSGRIVAFDLVQG